jgi:hypothetical protein
MAIKCVCDFCDIEILGGHTAKIEIITPTGVTVMKNKLDLCKTCAEHLASKIEKNIYLREATVNGD